MEYIINTFDKEAIYKLAFFLHGEIVNHEESLVIVDSDDEMKLQKEVEKILGTDVFTIDERIGQSYSQRKIIDCQRLINWSETSRYITGGDRNCIRPKKIPKKHLEKMDELFTNTLPGWWKEKRASK